MEEDGDLELLGEGDTHGSMLTGVASLIADKTGGVMSQLSKRNSNTKFTL